MEPAAILQELHAFREMGRVLYVAAHPDDENTQLITYLARKRGYATAYLSLTRGEGGQNLLGSDLGDALGVARTQELLAARQLDSGRQYFARAVDFGFSKDYQETLGIWDRQAVLSDVVRVIRLFRPDIVVTRFSPQPGGTHGHHTASAVLALEAFKLAGDPGAFPDHVKSDGLAPWQPRRIFHNGRPGAEGLVLSIDGVDPVFGVPYVEIAARSRAMHKTQGFDGFGFGNRPGPRTESFQLLAGEPATDDIMEGVDCTWGRVPGGAAIGALADRVIEAFDLQNPAASVPALLEIRRRIAALPGDRLLEEKHRHLDRVLQACLGLGVGTTVPGSEIVPGESLDLRHEVILRAPGVPVRWSAVRYPAIGQTLSGAIALTPGEASVRTTSHTLPASTALSQPYWLREEGTVGMDAVSDRSLIGTPQNPPAFPVEHVFEIAGQLLVVRDEPVQLVPVEGGETIRRPLDVIPPVSLDFGYAVDLFAPGGTRDVGVMVTAHRPRTTGTLELEAPAGWSVGPARQGFELAAAGDQARLVFTVTAPPEPATARLAARVAVGGMRYESQRIEVRYPHLPRQLLHPPARLKAVCLDLAIRGRSIGYLAGAGDNVADSLSRMGYAVTMMSEVDLTSERLREFDAVVIGVRAFNTRNDLAAGLPALFDYVDGGGVVVAQYNNPRGLRVPELAPFPLQLSGDRVTDENAAVTVLVPDHPALNMPNQISPADFDGWVQERGLYFPNQWDEHFTALLACGDRGEAPLSGGLLVARHGRGYYVYTGLAFFRQLPAGVPGAHRLFANLVSLGK